MPILSSSAVLSASFSAGNVPTAQDFENLILSFATYDGTLPIISGSITGTGSFGQLNVTNVGTNLIPHTHDTIDLGSTAVRWRRANFSTASISWVSGSLIPHADSTYYLGNDLYGYKETHTDTASIGLISSSLTPDADNSWDLGASGKEWKDLYVDGIAYIDRISNTSATTIDTASIGVISSSLLPDGNNIYDLGATGSFGWKDLYVSGTATIGTLSVSALDGVSITSISSSTGQIIISGSIIPFISGGTSTYDLGTNSNPWLNLYLSGSIIADSASIGVAKFNAISSSLIPDANNTYNLGSATLKWGTIHVTTITGSNIIITGSNTLSAESASISYLSASSPIVVGASILPDQTSSHDLGSSTFKWRDLYISRKATITTGSFTNLQVDNNVTSDLIPSQTNYYNLGSSTRVWNNLYIKNITSTGNTILGTASMGRVGSSLVSDTNDNDSLGSSIFRWRDLHIGNNAYINNLVVSGTLGNITASGNISASGDIYGTNINLVGGITASGDISSSGTIIANNIIIGGGSGLTLIGNISTSGDITTPSGSVIADTGSFNLLSMTTSSANLVLTDNISASGYVSASKIDAITGSFDYLETAEWMAHTDDAQTGIQLGSDTVDILANTSTIARFRTTAGTILGNSSFSTSILGSTLTFTGNSTFANSILIGGTGSLTTSTFVSASEFIGNLSASNIVQPFTSITASVISGACLQLSSSGLFVQDLCGEAYINLHGYNSRIVFTPLSGGLENVIYNGLSITGSSLRVGGKTGLGIGTGAATEILGSNVNLKATGTINLEAENNQIAFWPGRENKPPFTFPYEPYVRWNYESGSRFSSIVHTEGSASHVNVTTMHPTGSLLIKPMDGFVFLSGSKSSSGTNLSVYGDITASANTSTSPHRLAIISASGAITASGLVLPTGSILVKDTNAERGKEAGYFLSQPFAELFGGGELGGGSQSMNPASPYMSHYTVARVHRGGELGDTGGDAPFKNLLTFGDHVWPTRISGSGVRVNSGDFDINLNIMPIHGGTGIMRWMYGGNDQGSNARWRWILKDSSSGVGAGPENPRVNVFGDWVIQTGEPGNFGGSQLAGGGAHGGTVYISGSNLSAKSVSGIGGNITASGQISASGNTNTLGNNVTLGDTCSDNIIINGAITASCDISASGTGSFGYISVGSGGLGTAGNVTLGTDCNDTITVNGELLANCDITASKSIVTSGSISAFEGYKIGSTTVLTSSYTTVVLGSTLLTGNGALDVSYAPIQLLGNITASSEGSSSGDISASGAIIASEANIIGNITASENISASGYVSASNFVGSFTGSLQATNIETVNITASIISSSGTSYLTDITASNIRLISGSIGIDVFHGGYRLGGTQVLTSSGATVKVGTGASPLRLNATEVTASRGFLISSSGGFYNYLHVIGDITASNISASGTIYAEDMILSDDLTVGDSFNVNGNISASGNITGFNLIATGSEGNITASGNILNNGSISTTNITASGNISASGTSHTFGGSITVDNNITADNLNLTADLTASGDISSSGNIIASGNITVNEITASGNISSSGTIFADSFQSATGGTGIDFNDNLDISGDITSSGNISSSGNIIANSFTGSLSGNATGLTGTPSILVNDITASGNISASGNLSATGDLDIDGKSHFTGNITASGNISASGAIYGTNVYLLGSGNHKISFDNATTNDQFILGGDDFITVDGDNFINLFADTKVQVYSPILQFSSSNASGNITASGNISASGTVLASEVNIIGNITSSGNISASGTVYASNFESAGASSETISFNDNLNITGNITASGNISASGNIINSGNVTSDGTGSFGRVEVTTDVSASGDVFANRLNLGVNGNITVQNTDGSYLNNGVFVGIAAGNLMNFGDSDWETGISGLSLNITPNMTASNISASSVLLVGSLTSSGVSASNIIAGNITSSNISASGTIYAEHLYSSDDALILDTLTVGANINAGANVSASGWIYAESASIQGDVTASKFVIPSASGHVTMSHYTPVTNYLIFGDRHSQTYVDTKDYYVFNQGRFYLGSNVTSNNSSRLIVEGSASIEGDITASNNISASGTIVGSNLSGTNTGDQSLVHLAVTGSDVIFSNITASGNISASGNITASNVSVKTDILVQTGSYLLGSGSLELSSSYYEPIVNSIFFGDPTVNHFFNTKDYYAFNSGRIVVGTNQNTNLGSLLDVQGSASFSSDITASGHVSSSGTVTAKDLIIDYDTLPSSDPSVKGQVYRNGSNQLFVSAG